MPSFLTPPYLPISTSQTLPTLLQQLLSSGLPADTPAVAVERGTTLDQRVVFSRLDQLPQRTGEAGLKSPTLLIIGEVSLNGSAAKSVFG